MKAFITGSYAYGEPTPFSDLDLVVRVDEATRDQLHLHLECECGDKDDNYQVIHARAGNVDLLFCTTDEIYEAWKVGTEKLIAEKPVTKERAIEVLEACGVPQHRRNND